MYDLTKLKSGDFVLCYGKGDLLADTEIAVQEIERKRLGLPENYPIATHVQLIVAIKDPTTMTRKKYFGLKTETHILTPGVYIFEEKADGVEYGLFIDRVTSTAVIKEPSSPYGEIGENAFRDYAIRSWVNSVTYGWISFVKELPHVFGWTQNTNTINWSMICSEFFAVCTNVACLALGRVKSFQNEGTTNPLEVDINKDFQVKTNIKID